MPGLSDGWHELAVFLDGEFYLHDMDWPARDSRLHDGRGTLSVSCVFVSLQDFRVQHEDYTCNADYSKFIAEDVRGVGEAA